MKPIELSEEQRELFLQEITAKHPEYDKIQWGTGKWSENQFLWFFKDSILECEIHWFEYFIRYGPYETILDQPEK